jgi:hypothetical protein
MRMVSMARAATEKKMEHGDGSNREDGERAYGSNGERMNSMTRTATEKGMERMAGATGKGMKSIVGAATEKGWRASLKTDIYLRSTFPIHLFGETPATHGYGEK